MRRETLVVQLTVDELEQRIRAAVRAELAERADEAWMTREQVAKVLRVDVRSVSNYVARGTLRAHKVGRLVRFKREEVDAFVEAGREGRTRRAGGARG